MLPFPDDYYTVKDKSHRDRAAGRLHRRGDAAERRRHADRGRAVQPQRRLQPRPGDHPEGPRARQPAGASRSTNPIPLNDLSRNESQDSKEPIVVIDAETGKRVPIWVEIDSNASTPDEHRGADPRRDPVRVRATATSSRCASSATRAATSSPRPRASATTATTCRRTKQRDQRPAQALRQDLPRPAQGEGQAGQPLPRLGLHRRQRREHRPAAAAHPQRRVRRARRHRPRRRRRPGHGAAVRRSTPSTVDPDPGGRAPGDRARSRSRAT